METWQANRSEEKFFAAIRTSPNTSTNVFHFYIAFNQLSVNESRLKALESHFQTSQKRFRYATKKFMFNEIREDDAGENNKPFNLMF